MIPETLNGNSTGQKVAAIWREVLQSASLPDDVSFLELGGDSLAAMSCIARMRTFFGVEFTIEDFFLNDSTIADFSRMIDDAEPSVPGKDVA
jgi:acyl carrier protein